MIPPASTRALLLGAILAAAGLVAPAMGDTFFFGYEGIGDGNSMSEAVAQAQPLVDYLSSEIPQHDFQLKVYLPTPAVRHHSAGAAATDHWPCRSFHAA